MLKEWSKKRRNKRELEKMDALWSMTGGRNCSLFPPSFYANHTEEEARQAEKEQLAECRRLIEQLE